MKKGYTLIAFGVLLCLTSIYNFTSSELNAFPGGSPGGTTGSPGDVQTCRKCHSGTAPEVKTNVLSSTIPSTGYVPGKTYTFTVNVAAQGIKKFGFEAKIEGADKVSKGKIVVTNTLETQLKTGTNRESVTQTLTGNAAPNETKTWSFDWVAPEKGTGTVTVYGSYLAADGTGATNDMVYTFSQSIQEDVTAGIGEISNNKFNAYPNPCKGELNVGTETQKICLNDLTGKTIATYTVANGKVMLNEIPNGIYMLTAIQNNAVIAKQRLVVAK